MVNIEIDHRDAPQAMVPARVRSTYGDVVEQAESHGPVWLGVVAGRADGGEGILRGTAEDRVDRRRDRARGAHRRIAGCGAETGIGVEIGGSRLRHRLQNTIHVFRAVHQKQSVARRQRGLDPGDGTGRDGPRRLPPLQAIEHRLEPGRRLGMPRSGVVIDATRVGKNDRGHVRIPLLATVPALSAFIRIR